MRRTFSFLGDQTKKLNVFFQHKMFLYSQVKFDEVSLRYFYLEYYEYENFVKSSLKPNTSGDVEMIDSTKLSKSKAQKSKMPMMKTLSSEYFDCDQNVKTVPVNKFSHIHTVSEISDKLIDMGWVYFIEESCNKMLYTLIDEIIGKYENITNRPVLDQIHEWFQKIVLKWLERILERENSPRSGAIYGTTAKYS
jgi:hypothetical protein